VPELLRCGRCGVASYCQKECQVNDWKQKHKVACDSYKRVGRSMELKVAADQEQARKEVFQRVRLYACAYAVFRSQTLGQGFLFIQSDSSLATLSLTFPKDSYGHETPPRSLLLYYLTLGEFDSEVSRDDFELAMVRNKLTESVQVYDRKKQVVVLMRFRCGHVALGTALLVPEFNVLNKLGRDYFSENNSGALQLNLDDV
jgi:hypothetical protein